jgi:hypothetical protein
MRTQEESKLEAEGHLRSAVIRMFDLKLKSGASAEQVSEFLKGCLDEAIALHRASGPAKGFDIYSLAGVMRSWHTETKFLMPDGSPRPLPLTGARSLKKLVAMHFSKEDFEPVFDTLRRSDLVRRSGAQKWLPAERHARVSKATSELLSHLAEGIGRLAETVMRNTQTRRKEDLLFERGCKVFQLPIAESKAYREYIRKQGLAFISAVDDWLESRALRNTDRKTKACSAGAFAFAFIDDERKPRRAGSRIPKRTKKSPQGAT